MDQEDGTPKNFGNTANLDTNLDYAVAWDWRYTPREVQVVEHCQWLKGKTLGPPIGDVARDAGFYVGVYEGDGSRYAAPLDRLYARMREALSKGQIRTVRDAVLLCEEVDRREKEASK